MRDALSLLDSCLSYTDGTVDAAAGARRARHGGNVVHVRPSPTRSSPSTAGAALRLLDDALARGADPQVFARDATDHMRGLLLAATVGDVAQLLEITPRGRRALRRTVPAHGRRARRAADGPVHARRTGHEVGVAAARGAGNWRWCAPATPSAPRRTPPSPSASRAWNSCWPPAACRAAAHPPRRPPRSPLPRPNLRPQSPRPSPARPGSSRRRNTSTPSPHLLERSNRRRVYEAMQFAGCEDGAVTVSFSKKNQMYKNLAERKPEEIARRAVGSVRAGNDGAHRRRGRARRAQARNRLHRRQARHRAVLRPVRQGEHRPRMRDASPEPRARRPRRFGARIFETTCERGRFA